MKPEEIYLLFLEEALELLPLIQAGLKELSQDNEARLVASSDPDLKVIAEILPLLNVLQIGADQVKDVILAQAVMGFNFAEVDELETLIGNLRTLLASFWEQNATFGLAELNILWQTYLQLKSSLLSHLCRSPVGQLGILVKGEFLFSITPIQSDVAKTNKIDTNWQETILDKNIVESLANLELTVANPNLSAQSKELKHQADIFFELGKLLELEELIAVAESVHISLAQNPQVSTLITQRALACWQAVQTALSPENHHNPREDWRNYLFLAKDSQSSTSTDINPQIAVESNLQTEPFFMWLSAYNVYFLPANLIFALVIPQPAQIQSIDNQQIFIWQGQNLPLYQLSSLLNYHYILPDDLSIHPSTLILVVKYNGNLIALEIGVEEPLVESSLAIKCLDPILSTPSYICGCTLLKSDRLTVVIDVAELLRQNI